MIISGGRNIKAKNMNQPYQLCLFILSTTTLFTDIKSTDEISHDWFKAQNHCFDRGLTIEKNRSNQPYWTGIYSRLTPWINILGCYDDSIESLEYVIKKTMIKSSVGMCQEICHHENIDQFAVKMYNCLCIESTIHLSYFPLLSPSDCNYTCGDNSDDIYSVDCGGESAYTMYKIQDVYFNSVETCLSLQCPARDKQRFIPKSCSKAFTKVCENMKLPDNEYASSWSLSMEQCKKSQPSTYLLGDIDLDDPELVCESIPPQLQVIWVGVARQIYTSIDQGWEIKEEQRETFLECQMCTNNDCQFRTCSDSLSGSIFCKSIYDTSQSQITEHFKTSIESFPTSTFMSNNLSSEELFASTSANRYYDSDQSPSTNDTHQMSSASDELALKISLPVIIVFIILLLCAMAVVFYSRRRKMKKADKNTKAKVKCGPRKNVVSNVDCVQNNSYFVLEQCPQYISKGSDLSNESPYNNSEEGVYDHLRDKKSRKPEVEDTYQHASAGVSRDMSEYDTMANAVNKKQEEDALYDYLHQDTNGNYACDVRAKNHLTYNPYDVAV